MKKKLAYLALVVLLSNVLLFACCVLPWYAVICISNWWVLLAIPATASSGFVLSWILWDLWYVIDDWLR